jgi:parallel beta-helix repeat protein
MAFRYIVHLSHIVSSHTRYQKHQGKGGSVMKKKTLPPLPIFSMLIALLLFTFTGTDACAGGGAKAGTEIRSLPYTISSSGFYYIEKDLSCAAGTHGITIAADNVTLDLMGLSLVGPGGSGVYDGIYMNGRTNVEIRNGTVRNFSRRGIFEDGYSGTGHRIINIRVQDNTSAGIFIFSTSNLVERCTAVGNGAYGIYAHVGATVTGNICSDNAADGIYTGFGATVTGNTCYNNNGFGICTWFGATVTGNTCYSNTIHGISASDGTTVTGNTCYDNDYDGINALYGTTVTGNTCRFNTGKGIHADGGATVTGNTCHGNGSHGIYALSGATIIGNTCHGNGSHGIQASDGSTVIGNTCYSNTNYGIYLGGDNFVDQNTATNNTANMNTCPSCTFGTNHAP